MIKSIELRNVRGKTGSFQLGMKTLVVGPNGSGKSTISIACQLALQGYVSGSLPSHVFANASGSDMVAGVKIGNHTILRQWVQGRTLSETISVDGASAPKGASEAMIGLATGNEMQIFDVPSFFAMTATEKRRTILHLVADDATLERVMSAETKARDTLNAKRRDRQVAEKAIESVSKTLSGMEKPSGNLEMIKKQLAETETLRNETRDKVSKGESNEAAKKQVETQLKSMAGYEKKLAESKEGLKTAEKAERLLLAEQEKLGKPETVGDIEPLPVRAQEVIHKAMVDLAIVADESECKDDIRTVINDLKGLLLSDETKLKNDLIIKEWQDKSFVLQDKIADTRNLITAHSSNINRAKAMLDAAKKAEKQIEKIGPGVDEKDRAALNGLDTQLADLRAKVNPLLEIAALTKQMEQAKLSAEKALAAEETAKKDLGKALNEQQKVVESAKIMLAERSKSILPTGMLVINDDGAKELSVAWDFHGLTRQRHTLSGGEKTVFDCAVGFALCPTGLAVVEAAEVDSEHLTAFLNHAGGFTRQLVVLSCHDVGKVPAGWTVINMEKP